MASKVILRCDTLNLALSDKTKKSCNLSQEIRNVAHSEKEAIFSVPVR